MFNKFDRMDLRSIMLHSTTATAAAQASREKIGEMGASLKHILKLLDRLELQGDSERGDNDPLIVKGIATGHFLHTGRRVVAPPEPRDPLEPYHREVLDHVREHKGSMAAAYKAVRVTRLRAAIAASSQLSGDEKKMWQQHLDLIHGEPAEA